MSFLGAAVLGSGIIGAVGSAAELAAKQIDGNAHFESRTLLVGAAKVTQAAYAAFLTFAIAFAAAPPVLIIAASALAAVMILTPLLNTIGKIVNSDSLKELTNLADRVVSIASKVINTSALAFVAFIAAGAVAYSNVTVGSGMAILLASTAGAGAGLGAGALNIAAYQEE